jgi:glycosyltransferase involved in cell wall biosynthesis
LRIAILQQSYGRFGGAERLAFSHYVQLRRMNRDVTLFYEGRVSPGWKKRLQGEPIQSIPSGIASHPSGMRHLMEFLRKLKDYDRVIIHHHVEPILAFYLSKLLGPKIIWYSGSVFELPWEKTITGEDYRRISTTVKRTGSEFYGSIFSKLLLSDPLYGLTVQLARAVDIETVRGFGKIIGNSIFLSNFLARVYGLKEVPSFVYPGPDPLLEQLSSAPPVREQDYMLAVGTLIPLKNIAGMIHAAANVRSSKIVHVGEGQEKSMLKDLAARLDVPIEFRGTSDDEIDLARAYSECKFLVHLSLYEPFGLTPVEAGLFGKPSIVTNLGGPPEVVMEGVTGYIVNPRDHQYIGAKMNALLADDSLRWEMGQRARENIVRNFTLERSTTRLLEEVES